MQATDTFFLSGAMPQIRRILQQRVSTQLYFEEQKYETTVVEL